MTENNLSFIKDKCISPSLFYSAVSLHTPFLLICVEPLNSKNGVRNDQVFFFQTVHFTSPVLCVSCIQCMQVYFCRVFFYIALYTYK